MIPRHNLGYSCVYQSKLHPEYLEQAISNLSDRIVNMELGSHLRDAIIKKLKIVMDSCLEILMMNMRKYIKK